MGTKFLDKKSNFISKLWSPLALKARVKVRRKEAGIEEAPQKNERRGIEEARIELS